MVAMEGAWREILWWVRSIWFWLAAWLALYLGVLSGPGLLLFGVISLSLFLFPIREAEDSLFFLREAPDGDISLRGYWETSKGDARRFYELARATPRVVWGGTKVTLGGVWKVLCLLWSFAPLILVGMILWLIHPLVFLLFLVLLIKLLGLRASYLVRNKKNE